MQFLDLTLASPEENLALDEALLERAEKDPETTSECLRLWEWPSPCIVLGRSSDAVSEVFLDEARRDHVPVLRRSSGGASVVIGRGCLLYSVLLSYEKQPSLRSLDVAHQWVMGRTRDALSPLVPHIQMQGTCDLTFHNLKFSGNALRCKRSYFLYHGTLLYAFDLGLIGRYLRQPNRQPDYRENREHASFVTNLPASSEVLRASLRKAWGADTRANPPPQELVLQLMEEKYRNPKWNRV